MIRLFHVTKRFGVNAAIDDITLRIRRGEFVFVSGPSGAGKTTFLRLLFGALSCSEGQILINGINLNRIKRLKLDHLRRQIGFVFQDFKLLNHKTVGENVAISLEVAGAPPNLIRKKTRQALKAVGLVAKEQAYPLQLSAGEQQRVAIARAVVNDPLILLADEPTGNLDEDITREIMLLFRSINLRGTTVVIATHNRELLEKTDERIVLLTKGRMLRDTKDDTR